MRLKVILQPLDGSDSEDVLVGMVVGKRWEEAHGQNVASALDAKPSSTIVELAHLGYERKHGRKLAIEEFEDRFEVDVDQGGNVVPADPSDPATAQS
jgi:hypothetical protein